MSRLQLVLFCLVSCSAVAMGQTPTLTGNASCAASTCHGGSPALGPAWRSSLSTWAALDPHAGAGLLLRDEDSRQIVTRLDPRAAESAAAFDNVLRTRCISCHATVAPQQCTEQGKLDDAVLAEGVSCESCHGAASEWLQPHYRNDFAGPSRFDPQTGMRDTESIAGRAETCVRCHVGSRDADGLVRDMNHDLIAAGHPALRFDLLLYNENLPAHWNPQSETGQSFNKSATTVRSIGRSINLAAASALTSQRARDHLQDPAVPWPELADYDCFACHQSLSMQQYRLPPSRGRKSTLHVSDGLPIWNAWHTINQLQLSESNLQALSPHASDPARVSKATARLAQQHRAKARDKAAETIEPLAALTSIRDQLRSRAPLDWHEAAIQYLEVDAALRDLARDASKTAQATRLLQKLNQIEPLLRFDPDRIPGAPAAYHSPGNFDAQAFREAMLSLFAPTRPAAALPRQDTHAQDAGRQSGTPQSTDSKNTGTLSLSRNVTNQP